MTSFDYRWTLKDAVFTMDRGTVFSCFSGGGGSSMGYKLAGFDVIGCNDIDPRMMTVYQKNHNPTHRYLESIRDMRMRADLPTDFFELDILDGSPPCTPFTVIGMRARGWGISRKAREGNTYQMLDDLFFEFIALAERLQPRVVIAENVKGLLMGSAKEYVKRIYQAFDEAGYYVQQHLLDAATMGVPQHRVRVFFIAIRKDIAGGLLEPVDMFTYRPKLLLEFMDAEIPLSEIEDHTDLSTNVKLAASKYWDDTEEGDNFSWVHPKRHYWINYKCRRDKAINTLIGGDHLWHYSIKRPLNLNEKILAATFPTDYDFCDSNPSYVLGMSVPPVMIARIAMEVYDQWLSKITVNQTEMTA